MANAFWAAVEAQLGELRSARNADDVLRILAHERNPYGDPEMVAGDGFFAGSGDDADEALSDAGWTYDFYQARYFWARSAPDGSAITYVEGDIYRGVHLPRVTP
jgi:hypothetical protein